MTCRGRSRRKDYVVVAAILWLLASSVKAAEEYTDPILHFVLEDGAIVEQPLSVLRKACAEEEIEVSDPYHGQRMRYVGLVLRCVLDSGFASAGGSEGLRGASLLLRALDGYTRPVSGQDLLETGAYLAFGEPELLARRKNHPPASSAFARIDRRGVDPSPFYLVWVGATQSDPHLHPWPYQLAAVEVATFTAAFPRTVPSELDSSDPGWTGYSIFQSACASCHAINGQGGKVGPDLNVPRSIVEYRPLDQIRAYIRNPEATRYTSMPAHPNLDETDLDALIAYFRAMSERKDDPGKRSGS